MADLEKIVKLVFEGDGAGLSREMKTVSRDFDNFSRDVQDATQPLVDFGVAAAKAEAGLILIAGAAMAAAISKAKEFQSAFSEILSLDPGETDLKIFGDLEGALLGFAQNSSKPLKDITDAFYNARSSGFDLQESFEILAQSEALATVGKSSLNDAFNILQSTLSNFGDTAGPVEEVTALLFKTVEQGKTKLELLETPLSKLAPLASGAGLGLDEMLTVVSALTLSGQPTAEAVSSIKAAISNILKPTESARDVVDDLGIKFGALALQEDGLISILKAIQEKTGGSTEKMAALFGSVEGLNAALYLTSEEGMRNLDKILERMRDGTDPVAEKFEAMKDDVNLSLRRLINNFDVVLIKGGLPILDSFGGAVSGLADVFKGVSFAFDTGAFGPVTDAVNAAFAEIEETLKTVAKNMPEALKGVEFNDLIDALKSLAETVGDGLGALLGDIDLTAVDGLRDAVQRAIDLTTKLTEFVDKFIETGVNPLLKVIGEIGEAATGDSADGAADFLGKISGYANLLNVTFGALDGIKTALIAISGIAGLGTIVGWIGTLSLTSFAAFLGTAGILGGGLLAVLAVINAIVSKTEQPIEVQLRLRTETFKEAVEDGINNPLDRMGRKTGQFVDETAERLKMLFSGDFAGLIERNNDFDVVGDRIAKDLQAGFDKVPMRIDTQTVEKDFLDLTTAPMFVDGLLMPIIPEIKEIPEYTGPGIKVPIEAKTTGPAIYTWVDENGTVHFSDDPASGGALAGLPEIAIQVSPGLDEAAAKDTVDKTKTYIEEIKAQAETLQTAIEWKAKLDIAEVEANSKIMAAAFESVGDAITASANAASDMVGVFAGTDDLFDKYEIRGWVEDQFEMQQQALDMQKQLIDSQTRLNDLRSDALESGEGAKLNITVDDSVTPAVKLVLFEVLNLLQIEMNEYADQYLLGVS